ncbi:MAG TPA: type II secretion system F family protein [Accumulibacter sp.]|uniref:type II secretion system F family protein n=1 Tax=Accumulibacter sp. TaxID=2053492 RepID=UPI00287959A1|nr:type II secretion system F family protein [Accumulibacter sp.]MDS4054372.1 type II secretion system F family protein [Accumulibacter sp.]HMV03948.1 type II secretion system F family protein [Accumulibacter sp.]HNC27759.1 type II secretion system F family protein [Accumulibacter sp.]HND38805.1 type II secretion system F family protein [Accumulibacter sp.]HNK03242.1 type II secretion system F family protein [Accumulibacter sp.]
MATAAKPTSKNPPEVKQFVFLWEGKNKAGKIVRGEQRATSETVVQATLRRQGILVNKISKQRFRGGNKISEKDITLFTRQLATMMKAGVPLLQTFEIVGRGHENPAVGKLLLDIKADVETGSSLSQAFRKYPLHFDPLYCNLVAAGEQAGILETLLDRLATYKEKMLAIKAKIKGALFYPVSIIIVAFVITAVIMTLVIPAFKEVFKSFGADLPTPTMVVIGMSDFVVEYGWVLAIGIVGAIYGFIYTWKRSEAMQIAFDRLFLRLPVFGDIIRKAVIARWTRTLATMFAAGVPLVESLESVGGAAGNYVYKAASKQIQSEVNTGTSLTSSMQNTALFPNMVTQMVAIGEESGALDSMLGKVADFFEAEVDDAVAALSSLMEPMIMVVLGVLIGGMVIAMYLPIFKLGAVVGG